MDSGGVRMGDRLGHQSGAGVGMWRLAAGVQLRGKMRCGGTMRGIWGVHWGWMEQGGLTAGATFVLLQ